MIVDDLLNSVKGVLNEREVADVRIGLSYTGVLLDNGSLGLAYSFREEATQCCEVVDSAGELEGDAFELARLALSPRAVDSSVGVATINAAINQGVEGEEGSLLEFLDIDNGDKIGMVGNFRPVINKIEKDINLYVFERSPQEDDTYPDWAVDQILPDVDVSIITGTSVVNKTIDHLIKLSENADKIAILGPTTPMSPAVFQNYGVNFLGGMIVEDVEKALRIISQGGGTRKLGRVSRKLSLCI